MNGQSPDRWVDPVIEAFKRDVDRTLLWENLKLTPEQRIRQLQAMDRFSQEMQRAMRQAKQRQ